MQRIGTGLPKPKAQSRRATSPAYAFVAIKAQWQEQIALDRDLSGTALRVALVVNKWLNSRSLQLWPSQATLAQAVASTPRAVRSALATLEKRGHLLCVSQYRGGRTTNRYRIILGNVVVDDEASAANENSEPSLSVELHTEGRPERPRPSHPHVGTSQPGTSIPVASEPAFRGTQERTPEKNLGRRTHSIDDPPPEPQTVGLNCLEYKNRGPRVTADVAKDILAEVFGEERMTGYGGVAEGE